ncbi:MAG TPA: hypothetical protein VFA83_15890, partial [Acidimicrobiales bacterium]|nr:hypothetical protein [Acidimicrobiales bacterium]
SRKWLLQAIGIHRSTAQDAAEGGRSTTERGDGPPMTMEGRVMGSKFRIAAVGMLAAFTSIGLGVFAPAANAAAGDTIATFTINGGALSISVPASTVNLGSVSAGSLTASGLLGATTVTDNRGALLANWTTTVTSTDFTTGTATTNETVTKANVSYASGASTSTTGTGVFTPTLVGLPLATAQPGALWAGVGVNTATWNPTISFVLSTAQVAGTYTGTINQSVA